MRGIPKHTKHNEAVKEVGENAKDTEIRQLDVSNGVQDTAPATDTKPVLRHSKEKPYRTRISKTSSFQEGRKTVTGCRANTAQSTQGVASQWPDYWPLSIFEEKLYFYLSFS